MQEIEPPPHPPGSGPVFRAAQYVRMSTEHQQYSTENQGDKIREYAARRNIEIVRTYADEGKSGLRIDGRQALQQLIADVQAGTTDFQIILVYDVSRWGRFQDADESAYYEYICRRAGIQVAYCAEQFENDGSPVSTIVKGVKRAMAGEYSRELSAKVRVYGAAKTVVDCFKHRNKIGLDVALEALKDVLAKRKVTADDLWRYAKICRVSNVMRPYLEAVE